MASSSAYFRVNINQLGQHVGKVVRVVGRVVHIDGSVISIRDDLDNEAKVVCTGTPRFNDGIIECIGTVRDDMAIAEMTATKFTDDFDMKLYREAILETQRFPALYPVPVA